jgi:formimidoylglutamate deiminase
MQASGGTHVSDLHFSKALLDDGWSSDVLLSVRDRKIAAITTGVPAPSSAATVGGVALPGMPNVHSHAFQRAMAGLTEVHGPEDDNFWTWREVMYRFLTQMTPDDIEAVAALAYVEMLEAGFTTVGEFHYLHNAPDGARYADPAETAACIVAAAVTTGIGLTLLPCFYAHGGCGGLAPSQGQRRFLSDLDSFAVLIEASRAHIANLPEARLGFAPHSIRAVTAEELAALVRSYATGPVHIHAAEQVREVDECVAWSGARPVQWLLDNMQLDERWCLIHCTHMTSEEIAGLARSGAVAGLCPITESNLGDGIFAAVEYERAAGRFAVGTDSNVRIAVNEELRTLEYSQRLRDRKRNRLGAGGSSTGRSIFEAALRGGAQALGLGNAGLAVGQSADIVVLDDADPSLVGCAGDALLDAWTFASGNVVRDVFAGGRHVVVNGRHVRRDDVSRRYAATLRRLLQQI